MIPLSKDNINNFLKIHNELRSAFAVGNNTKFPNVRAHDMLETVSRNQNRQNSHIRIEIQMFYSNFNIFDLNNKRFVFSAITKIELSFRVIDV